MLLNFTLPLLFVSGSFQMSHPQKSDLGPGGEDSFFISPDNRTIGVADGVGGWRKHDESSSHKWSQSFMQLCQEFTLEGFSPYEAVNRSYDAIDKTIVGSTTVSVAQLISLAQYEQRKLQQSNDFEIQPNFTAFVEFYTIGDSLCSIMRPGVGTVFTTNKTAHEFNFPYQLGSRQVSEVNDGTIEIFPIQTGDFLLCSSDGVWDNLFPAEILDIIEKEMKKNNINEKEEKDVQKLQNFVKQAARQIVRQSYIRGSKHNTETPFSNSAAKAGLDFIGGKLDDTTAVLSYLTSTDVHEAKESDGDL